ncbi:uncharacterized protein LOC143623679 [Bidens hawaiensis]|uniref:uncharacterized protein LOC143623679 n=1 Tax=Bidens hawaiensis TaxID=980011 RepID=UPI00404B2908
MKKHYDKLGSYLETLKQTNPGLTFEIVTVPPQYYNLNSDDEVFSRLFVCFDPVKKGFLSGCRRLLCLDGCFLKTFLGGMLLAAIGRDVNDQMCPVAWAVVEGETNDSWQWFMAELKKCLEVIEDGMGWTLVSDQQKGLLNAAALIWSNAEHRNCSRHIYANWHKTYKGDDLKELFWIAARSYSMPDFKKAIREMRQVNADATEALLKQNPKCFCRCYLKTENKTDAIVNNIAEAFNEYILQSISKHIITILENIILSIMTSNSRDCNHVMIAINITIGPKSKDFGCMGVDDDEELMWALNL